eukprot:TRINITY_DN11395_c0_g1_i2.p1 TRINITY_DN11395_c0_g1~~TRINITY_DN11395_c0_g1_i2.p1  ORF type:complete len:187 (-),score=46.29 TRINITY_DN11395_c0_g1_i2:160-720(-)
MPSLVGSEMCIRDRLRDVVGVNVIVRGVVQNPAVMDKHIDEALLKYHEKLSAMNASKFDGLKRSKIRGLLEPFASLRDESRVLSRYIQDGSYAFMESIHKAEALRALTFERFIEIYKRAFVNDRIKVSYQVYGDKMIGDIEGQLDLTNWEKKTFFDRESFFKYSRELSPQEAIFPRSKQNISMSTS